MTSAIRGISSMATRQVLAELVQAYAAHTGCQVEIESVGGVDAARRVQAGEAFDMVVLASDAIERLITSGRVLAGSRVDLVRSPVAVAVRAGAARPDLQNEASLRLAVTAARSIGFSTGPSGTYLTRLFERWGLTDTLRERMVQAPPGVPVAALVARGDIELGFQQLSELLHVEGIAIAGLLPTEIEFITTFSAGVCAGAAQAQAPAVRGLLDFMTSPAAAEVKRKHGLEPA